MKKFIQYIFLFALIGLMTECKKGEDDPFMSMRSRKARVAGDWTLTSGSSTDISVNGGNSSTTIYNYTENAYTRNYTSGAVNTTTSGVYSLKMTFEKDGSFTWTETMNSDVTTFSGVWNFTGKVGDEYKNKSQIVMKLTSYTSTSPNSTYSGTSTGKDIDFAFSIKELRNKKMVLIQKSTSASSNSSYSSDAEYTFEQ